MSKKLSDPLLPDGAAIADADLFYSVQGGISVRQTALRLATHVRAGLAAVALSGAYADLSGTPTLAAVATSGSASDLGTGTLPSARIDLTAAYAFTGLGATNLLSASILSWNSDVKLGRLGSANLGFGVAADTTGTSYTISGTGVTTGGTNNQAGGNLTIASGQGKGTAISSLLLQTPTAGASGNTLQTQATRLTLSDGSVASGKQASIVAGTLGDQAQSLSITATQPTTPTGEQSAISFVITGNGTASQTNGGLVFNYGAGYTGSSRTYALAGTNSNSGTGTEMIPASGSNIPVSNHGTLYRSIGSTTGTNLGVIGIGQAGNVNAGVLGFSQVAKDAATNIGVVGSAINTGASSPVQIGGFFTLNRTTVPTVNAALIADNGSQTDPIFLARDNGSTVFTIADGGNVTSTGTLTTVGGATLHTTSSALTNGAGVATGTLTTAPAAGNPTKWIGINDNGTTRYIPAW